MPQAELPLEEKQKNDQESLGDEKVLPLVRISHAPQRNKIDPLGSILLP
jgi:hypothetical protein